MSDSDSKRTIKPDASYGVIDHMSVTGAKARLDGKTANLSVGGAARRLDRATAPVNQGSGQPAGSPNPAAPVAKPSSGNE